MDSQT